MRLSQIAALRFGLGIATLSTAVLAMIAGGRDYDATVAAQTTNSTPARPPLVDEYYPVKLDWIGADRSILTIKHVPTASCYILVYPSGDVLTQVESERCAAAAPVER